MAEKKAFLLRLDPAVHDAMQRWAADDLRSLNAHIEFVLRRALRDAGRLSQAPAAPAPAPPTPTAEPDATGSESSP
jgi:hypothetical protein